MKTYVMLALYIALSWYADLDWVKNARRHPHPPRTVSVDSVQAP